MDTFQYIIGKIEKKVMKENHKNLFGLYFPVEHLLTTHLSTSPTHLPTNKNYQTPLYLYISQHVELLHSNTISISHPK